MVSQHPPAPREINGCVIDARCLRPLSDSMICSGPDYPRDDWNHSCIHPETVAYSCGRLFRPDRPNQHDHDAAEIKRCRDLANEAAQLMKGIEINDSESSSNLAPFFITANRGDIVPASLSADFIRVAFNETIYPQAKITIAPLKDKGPAWEAFAVPFSLSFDCAFVTCILACTTNNFLYILRPTTHPSYVYAR